MQRYDGRCVWFWPRRTRTHLAIYNRRKRRRRKFIGCHELHSGHPDIKHCICNLLLTTGSTTCAVFKDKHIIMKLQNNKGSSTIIVDKVSFWCQKTNRCILISFIVSEIITAGKVMTHPFTKFTNVLWRDTKEDQWKLNCQIHVCGCVTSYLQHFINILILTYPC